MAFARRILDFSSNGNSQQINWKMYKYCKNKKVKQNKTENIIWKVFGVQLNLLARMYQTTHSLYLSSMHTL